MQVTDCLRVAVIVKREMKYAYTSPSAEVGVLPP